MLTTRGKVYRLTSRQSIHMKPSNKVIYIWNQGKRLEMAPRGWQANGFWIVRRNGKMLIDARRRRYYFLLQTLILHTKIASPTAGCYFLSLFSTNFNSKTIFQSLDLNLIILI